MPAIEYFDEDAHAARNGFGDDERDFDLFRMPKPYTYDELLNMAAVLDLNDTQQEEPYAAVVSEMVTRITIGESRSDAERQTLVHASAQVESVLARVV